MNNKLRTAWAVAGILAILLVIMTVMWGRASGAFGDNLTAQGDKVAEACKSADDLNSPACRDALDDLARLLARFERRIERQQDDANAAKVEVATTTVEVTQ